MKTGSDTSNKSLKIAVEGTCDTLGLSEPIEGNLGRYLPIKIFSFGRISVKLKKRIRGVCLNSPTENEMNI